MEKEHDGEAQERGGEGVVNIELHLQVRIFGDVFVISVNVGIIGVGIGGFQGSRSR